MRDDLVGLQDQLKKSDKKIKELRNLLKDIESKLIVENSFQRYVRDKIAVLQKEQANLQRIK